jgi:hypothetical protein
MNILHAVDSVEIVRIFFEKTGIKLKILIAYNYIKGNSWKLTDLYRKFVDLLYLDSGAFGAYTGKAKIDLNG